MRSISTIFVSYSHKDGKEIAENIDNFLTTEGYLVWRDNGRIAPGEDWMDAIDRGIRGCDLFLYVATLGSLKSRECKSEWNSAFVLNKRIVSLVLPNAQLPPRLAIYQALHFNQDDHKNHEVLLEHFAWLKTPDGYLNDLEGRFNRLRTHINEESSQERRAATELKINELSIQIDRMRELIADPKRTAEKRIRKIEQGIERARRPSRETERPVRTKFLNCAPAEVPDSFQDRISETQTLVSFLKSTGSRCAFVVGRGGEGKTTLVCRILDALQRGATVPDTDDDLKVDGIIYLSAKISRQPSFTNLSQDLAKLIPQEEQEAAKNHLASPNLSVEAKIQYLCGYFTVNPVVVLLDNLETYVDAESRRLTDLQLEESIRAVINSPGHSVKILATSRIPPAGVLGIRPTAQLTLDLENGLPSPYGEQVLRDLDRTGAAGLRDAPDECLKAARDLCNGNPRALEAFVSVLLENRYISIEELIERGRGGAPEQIAQILVGEAYDCLDMEAQIVVQALAIYGTPVGASAVDYLLFDIFPAIDSDPILERLINTKIVRREGRNFFLHPIDSEHALQRLNYSQSGQSSRDGFNRKALKSRSADYFVRTSLPRSEWQSLEDLQPQLNEIRLRVEAEQYDQAAKVLLDIGFDYLHQWGHISLLLELWETVFPKLVSTDLKRRARQPIGSALMKYGRWQDAVDQLEIDLNERIEESDSIYYDAVAVAYCNLGSAYEGIGNIQKALELYDKAIEIDEHRGNYPAGLWIDYCNKGMRYSELGNYHDAEECFIKSLNFANQSGGMNNGDVRFCNNMGILHLCQGESSKAIDYLNRARQLSDAQRNAEGQLESRSYLMLSYLFLNEPGSAAEIGEEIHDIYHPNYSYRAFVISATANLLAGRQPVQPIIDRALEEASTLLKRCDDAYRAHFVKGMAMILNSINCDESEFESALFHIRKSVSICSASGIHTRSAILVNSLSPIDSGGIVERALLELGESPPLKRC